MPISKTVWLYQFDELGDKAKETARDWYRSLIDGKEISEPVYEDFLQICEILGIEIKNTGRPCIWWSGFSSQGDGACFEGTYQGKKDAPSEIRKYAPLDEKLHRIADALHTDFVEPYDGTGTVLISHRGKYYHAYTMRFEAGNWEGSDGEIHEVSMERCKTVAEQMVNFANWLYRHLSDQNDYLNSAEAVEENIRANKYTFLVDGTREDEV